MNRAIFVTMILISSVLSGCLDGVRDSDGDGLKNDSDNCPDVSNPDQINYDDDSFGNDCDLDDDNDGVPDDLDLCDYGEKSWVSSESTDFDLDGCRDSTEDEDDDNDGVSDIEDIFPRDANESADSDGDVVGDNADAFPLDPSESADSDGDGMGDNADTDDDGDGVSDSDDAFPLDPSETSDFDSDGIGDNADTDDDNDGVSDSEDWFFQGNGAILLEFTEFQIWSGGSYDENDGTENSEYPDVYAYVGIGDCVNEMEYNDYWDDINTNAAYLYNWESLAWDINDGLESVCFSITIYDENPGLFAYDDILDFVPGDNNGKSYQFDLVSGVSWDDGEGAFVEYFDNRGENSLSIMVEYQFSTFAVQE